MHWIGVKIRAQNINGTSHKSAALVEPTCIQVCGHAHDIVSRGVKLTLVRPLSGTITHTL